MNQLNASRTWCSADYDVTGLDMHRSQTEVVSMIPAARPIRSGNISGESVAAKRATHPRPFGPTKAVGSTFGWSSSLPRKDLTPWEQERAVCPERSWGPSSMACVGRGGSASSSSSGNTTRLLHASASETMRPARPQHHDHQPSRLQEQQRALEQHEQRLYEQQLLQRELQLELQKEQLQLQREQQQQMQWEQQQQQSQLQQRRTQLQHTIRFQQDDQEILTPAKKAAPSDPRIGSSHLPPPTRRPPASSHHSSPAVTPSAMKRSTSESVLTPARPNRMGEHMLEPEEEEQLQRLCQRRQRLAQELVATDRQLRDAAIATGIDDDDSYGIARLSPGGGGGALVQPGRHAPSAGGAFAGKRAMMNRTNAATWNQSAAEMAKTSYNYLGPGSDGQPPAQIHPLWS